MNINENYGNVELPSQIADSFEHQNDQNSVMDDEMSGNIHSNIKNSLYLEDDLSQSHGLNIDSSFEDTFLANLPLIIQKENLKNLEEQDVQQPEISISKTKIVRNALPKEEILEFIQIINSSSKSIILTLSCARQIQVLSTESYEPSFQNKFSNNNIRQLYLQPWQKVQVGFKITKNQDEFGDIFETISLQYKFQQREKKTKNAVVKKKRSFIDVEVHYVTPKLKINYQGCSDVATICLNKVSMNKIAKNKFGEYYLTLGLGGVERFQCILETRGNIKIFPNQLILYQEEQKKITFKPNSTKGAIIIKAKNAKVNFVFGVQLI